MKNNIYWQLFHGSGSLKDDDELTVLTLYDLNHHHQQPHSPDLTLTLTFTSGVEKNTFLDMHTSWLLFVCSSLTAKTLDNKIWIRVIISDDSDLSGLTAWHPVRLCLAFLF